MNKVNNMLVAVFISKTKEAGEPGWAFVSDFNNGQDFIDWFSERRRYYRQVAVTWYGDFNLFEEIDEFKKYLKGMLGVDSKPNLTDAQWEKYADLNMDMFHYKENEFDKMINNYGGR